MFKKILVPLDRSPVAEQALGRAAAIARAYDASIDLILVHEPFAGRLYLSPESEMDTLDGEQHYIERMAAEVCSGSSLSVTAGVHRGSAAQVICDRARETQADLIVMTSHGRTGLGRMWLGSVADAVVRNSPRPVLLLRPIEVPGDKRAARHLFKHILVPIDGSALSAEIFPAATDIARASGAKITLLRVIAPLPMIAAVDVTIPFAYTPMIPDEAATRRLQNEVAAELEEIAQRLREQGHVSVNSAVLIEERVGAAINDYARAQDVDLIAMCTHGRGATRLLVGSVADKVLRGSGLPILLHRPTHLSAEPTVIGETAMVDEIPALSP